MKNKSEPKKADHLLNNDQRRQAVIQKTHKKEVKVEALGGVGGDCDDEPEEIDLKNDPEARFVTFGQKDMIFVDEDVTANQAKPTVTTTHQ